MRKLIIFSLLFTLLTSCGEYYKVQKSTDYDYKLDYAKRAFESGKYVQASTILTDIVTVFKGTPKAEESLYLLALSHYENKDYVSSGAYFNTYYTRYPKGKYTELARYYCGYGYYLDSPESQLDQSGTLKAIEELQAFLDYYPKSDKVTIAQNAIFELQDKLTLKELQNAQLYYNLGNYMGNNYLSCIITAQNALNDYPYTKLREDLSMLILRARYSMAKESVQEKMIDRYRDTVDEYYAFKNEYPESKFMKEADKIYRETQKVLKNK
jgi:outer membrane protein assembly factor BamD